MSRGWEVWYGISYMREIISAHYRTILIHTIRLLPLLCATAILFGALETLYSISVDNSNEYTYDDGTSYIVYNTPIADWLAGYLSSCYAMIGLLFLLSKVFLFCKYHRVFIWFMLGNRVMDEYGSRIIWSADMPKMLIYVTIAAWVMCLFIALYLHQKYGDRETS